MDLYKMLELFDKNDCKFKSATEVYDTTTAMGRLFITIVASLAQWERETIGERVRVGLEEKVRQGKYAAQVEPYGYTLKNGELTIQPDEAKIVKRIFTKYLEGESAYKIAEDLIGLPGRKWSNVHIYTMLKNPLYKGTLRWGSKSNNYFEVDEAIPPIISEEVFEQVQFHMKTRGSKHPRAAVSNYIFTTLAKCVICGNTLSGSKTTIKGKEYVSYRCVGRNSNSKKCNFNIPAKTLEKLFLEKIKDLQFNRVVDKVNTTIDTTEDNTEDLEQELKTIVKRRKKWQYAWANDAITDEEFTQLMKEETDKENSIKEKLLNSTPIRSQSKEEIQSLLLNIEQSWGDLTDYEKKTSLSILIESFVIDRTGVKFKYEFNIKDILFK
jgi:site-specific DNA recombinase